MLTVIFSTLVAAQIQCRGFDVCPPFPQPYNGTYPHSYDYKGAFPKGFAWGLGTAAYQIEGAYNSDGRGASIWDTFTGADTVGMVGSNCSAAPCPINAAMFAKGATGNVANDHYHRMKDDVASMKAMGLKHYRFSISWPRVVPTGRIADGVNAKALSFYSSLVDELLAAGITPAVTMYHWDLPQALLAPQRGAHGWYGTVGNSSLGTPDGSAPVVAAFTEYADVLFRSLGDRVKMWLTFNEAWTFTWLASGAGKAPCLSEYADMQRWPLVAGHNVLLAHAEVVQLYREKYQASQGGQIGITNNCDWREPLSPAPENVGAAERATQWWLGWFADPIFGADGDYPPAMRRVMGDRLPRFTDAQKRKLRGSADFFGLNSYGTGFVTDAGDEAGFGQNFAVVSEVGLPQAQSSWLYGAAWGLRKLLNWVHNRYYSSAAQRGRGLPIYVTEGGWSLAADNATAAAQDPQRVQYYANYTQEIQRAIELDGIDVKGFYAWSLMDNFEWERGYTERFGVQFNDFAFGEDPRSPVDQHHQPTEAGQKRTPKNSLRWLQSVWKANAMVDPTPLLGART